MNRYSVVEQEISNRNEDNEVPAWLSDIVARFKQSSRILTVEDLAQLNLSNSLKGFLIDIIMCADNDKCQTPNPQFLQEIIKLDIQAIQEIMILVDGVLSSQNKGATIQPTQHQNVLLQSRVIPRTVKAVVMKGGKITADNFEFKTQNNVPITAVGLEVELKRPLSSHEHNLLGQVLRLASKTETSAVGMVNDDNVVPPWLSYIVARFKQSGLTLTIEDLAQLNLYDSVKGFLIDVIMCADNDKCQTPNPQFLQEIIKLDMQAIQEITILVDGILSSQNKGATVQPIQHQNVLLRSPVFPQEVKAVGLQGVKITKEDIEFIDMSNLTIEAVALVIAFNGQLNRPLSCQEFAFLNRAVRLANKTDTSAVGMEDVEIEDGVKTVTIPTLKAGAIRIKFDAAEVSEGDQQDNTTSHASIAKK